MTVKFPTMEAIGRSLIIYFGSMSSQYGES